MPPPVVNRLVSSATAVPFVPEQKDEPKNVGLGFSCIVDPPPKKERTKKSSEGSTAPMPVENPRGAATAAPAPARPTKAAPVSGGDPKTATAATTVPPFGVGASTAPFAGESTAPFDFNPPPPPRKSWLSWSTLLFVVAAGAGYYQYQRMQEASAPAGASTAALSQAVAQNQAATLAQVGEPGAAGADRVTAGGKAVGAGVENGATPPQMANFASPFTALKQAKATIKDAGAKHKAAYDTVEAMLDDPTGAAQVPTDQVGAAPKPAAPAAPVVHTITPGVKPLDAKGAPITVNPEKPAPGAQFMQWAKTVRIGGMRPGATPRALIGGAAYAAGDLVDFRRGVVFLGFDEETRSLRFGDASGAELSLKL